MEGGGSPGLVGAGGGKAGVVVPVGGWDACAEVNAWGVAAADMLRDLENSTRVEEAPLVFCLLLDEDALGAGGAGLRQRPSIGRGRGRVTRRLTLGWGFLGVKCIANRAGPVAFS